MLRPIYIPNKNEDSFIRRAYYGGHTDTYKPYGEDLYYYDVNSLYPFVMKEFPMPGGVPVWHRNLDGKGRVHLILISARAHARGRTIGSNSSVSESNE